MTPGRPAGDAAPTRRPDRLVVETDGGSRGNPGPAGYGAVVRDESGAVLAERAGYLGATTNNVAEYSGLVAGLRAAWEINPAARVEVRADSKLLVEQMSGRWQIKHEDMRRLAAEARAAFPPQQVRYTWVPRAQNTAADALANTAMDTRGSVHRDGPVGGPPADRTREAPADAVEPGVTGPHAPVAAPPPPPPGSLRAPVSTALGAAPHVADGPPVTVVLVRHGQTDATAARTYAGGDTPGAPLNPRGRTEAARAADLVARIGAGAWTDLPRPSVLLASSMLRAQQTATAIGRRLGIRPEVDDSFAECRFGAWDGLTAVEIEARWPGRLGEWLTGADVAPPEGESMPSVAARVDRALARLREAYAGRTVVVATHTIAVRTGVGALARIAPGGWHSLRVPPGSVTIVRLWEDDHEVTVLGCPSDL